MIQFNSPPPVPTTASTALYSIKVGRSGSGHYHSSIQQERQRSNGAPAPTKTAGHAKGTKARKTRPPPAVGVETKGTKGHCVGRGRAESASHAVGETRKEKGLCTFRFVAWLWYWVPRSAPQLSPLAPDLPSSSFPPRESPYGGTGSHRGVQVRFRLLVSIHG